MLYNFFLKIMNILLLLTKIIKIPQPKNSGFGFMNRSLKYKPYSNSLGQKFSNIYTVSKIESHA